MRGYANLTEQNEENRNNDATMRESFVRLTAFVRLKAVYTGLR